MIIKSKSLTDIATKELSDALLKTRCVDNPTEAIQVAQETTGNILVDNETNESFSFTGNGSSEYPMIPQGGTNHKKIEFFLHRLSNQRNTPIYYKFNDDIVRIEPDSPILNQPNKGSIIRKVIGKLRQK